MKISEYTEKRADVLRKMNISGNDFPLNLKIFWFDTVTSFNIYDRIYAGTHSHSFTEIQFVFSGSVRYDCGGETFEVKEGEALLISADVPHRFLNCDDNLIKGSIAFSADGLSLSAEKTVKFTFTDSISEAVNFIFRHCDAEDIFAPLLILGRTAEIIYSVCNILSVDIPGVIDRSIDSRVAVAKKYVINNKNRIISCEDVARECGLSSRQLNRIFKNTVGCSLFNFIIETRLSYAKKLLIREEYSIKEIGYMLGFENESSFISFFKRHCSISPGVYRKEKISEI